MFETYFLPVIIFVVLGCIAGLLLSVAQKIFAVKTDERVEQVREALPGANCGACGFAGCDEYAAAVVTGDVPLNKCIPGGEKTVTNISAIMGKEAEAVEKTVEMCIRDRRLCRATVSFLLRLRENMVWKQI